MKINKKLLLVEKMFKHEFRDKNLLIQACTHSSLKKKGLNNEVLEFLGDAVFLSIITDILVREYPESKEGHLTKVRSQLVTNQNLALTIKKMGLEGSLKIVRGQKITPGILADFFEAIVGAIYLDGGNNSSFYSVRKIYENYWKELSLKNTDFKTQLQELSQKKFKVNPEYKVVEMEGKPHEPIFTVAVLIKSEIISLGKGNSKKEAEQQGARLALDKVKKI